MAIDFIVPIILITSIIFLIGFILNWKVVKLFSNITFTIKRSLIDDVINIQCWATCAEAIVLGPLYIFTAVAHVFYEYEVPNATNTTVLNKFRNKNLYTNCDGIKDYTTTIKGNLRVLHKVLCLSRYIVFRLIFNMTLSCLLLSSLLRMAYVIFPIWMKGINQRKAKWFIRIFLLTSTVLLLIYNFNYWKSISEYNPKISQDKQTSKTSQTPLGIIIVSLINILSLLTVAWSRWRQKRKEKNQVNPASSVNPNSSMIFHQRNNPHSVRDVECLDLSKNNKTKLRHSLNLPKLKVNSRHKLYQCKEAEPGVRDNLIRIVPMTVSNIQAFMFLTTTFIMVIILIFINPNDLVLVLLKQVYVFLFQILFPLSIIFGVPRLRKKAISNINKILSTMFPTKNAAAQNTRVYSISNQAQINDIELLELPMSSEQPSTSRFKEFSNRQETELGNISSSGYY